VLTIASRGRSLQDSAASGATKHGFRGLNDGRIAVIGRMSSASLTTLLPTKRQALIVATVVLLLSWLLHLLTRTPFSIVISRVRFVGICRCWRIPPPRPCVRRGSRSAARLLAIALMAPLASLTTAFLAQGANVLNYLSETQTLTGHIFMAIVGLVFGLVMSLVAMRSERRQTERADRLQAELEKTGWNASCWMPACGCCNRRSNRIFCSTRWPTSRHWWPPVPATPGRCCGI
jgi:hypothetical protein